MQSSLKLGTETKILALKTGIIGIIRDFGEISYRLQGDDVTCGRVGRGAIALTSEEIGKVRGF